MAVLVNTTSCNYTFNNGFSDTYSRNASAWTFDSTLTDVGTITVQLSKESGYTGLIQGAIWDTDGTELQTTSSINASVLDDNDGSISSYQTHTFTFSTTDLTTGQFIGLKYADATTPPNRFLYIARSGTANTCSSPAVSWHGSYDSGATWDSGHQSVGGVVIETGSPAPTPGEGGTFMPPPIAHVRL